MRVSTTILALLLISCTDHVSKERYYVKAEPVRWSVAWVLSSTDSEGTYTDRNGAIRPYAEKIFTFRNVFSSAYASDLTLSALNIHAVNLIAPDGTILTDGLISRLFQVERPKVDSEGIAVEGEYEPISENSFINVQENAVKIAPLCPVDSYGGIVSGSPVPVCNSVLPIRVRYHRLTDEEYAALKKSEEVDYGDYFLEICASGLVNGEQRDTCPQGQSRRVPIYRFPPLPPKPFIGLRYLYPAMGYKDHRVMDPVIMDVSSTCPGREDLDDVTREMCENNLISDTVQGEGTISLKEFKEKCCMSDWQERYCLKYRWELVETPTPDAEETRIRLDNIIGGGEGPWYSACGYDDPTLASFTGQMITPTPAGKYYKVRMSVVTVDKQTQLESDIADKIDAPNIIPRSRVIVQLTWKEGLLTSSALDGGEGVAVDLDLHLIKRKGMDACGMEMGKDGLLCTKKELNPSDDDTVTHDDCHWGDPGCMGTMMSCNVCDSEERKDSYHTVSWYASFDIDNTWGGADYGNPETINLGPVLDEKGGLPSGGDGILDFPPYSDDYLVIVNYHRCWNLKDEDQSACQLGGAEYAVHGRIEIFVDGDKAPRLSKDGRPDDEILQRIDFVVHPEDWIAINLITWGQDLTTGKWQGDAVVRNVPSYLEKVCNFKIDYCSDTPIWGDGVFEAWVSDPTNTGNGTCYDYTGE